MFEKVILTITAILLFFKPGEVKSQNTEAFLKKFTVRQYTDEHGLPQNSVKSLAADKDGFIWLATENGLVRFDGLHFYTFGKQNTGITDSRLFELQPSLEADTNCFYASSHNATLKIKNGIALADSMYRKNFYHKIPFTKERDDEGFLSDGLPHKVNAANKTYLRCVILCPEAPGSYYITDKHKVEYFTNWNKSWEKVIPNKNYQNYFRLHNELYQFSKGYIQHILSSGSQSTPVKGDILKDDSYNAGKADPEIYWNNITNQVFILLRKKFYQLKQSHSGWNTKLIQDGFDFKMNNITSVYYDSRDGRLFLGSLTRGLFVISKKHFYTLTISNHDTANVMYAQTLNKNKEIVIPLGYAINCNRIGSEHAVKNLPSISSGLNQDRHAILTDQKHNLWIKNVNLLYQYNSKGDRLLHSWKFTDEIKTLYKGRDGRIWLAMKFQGLYYFDSEEITPRLFKLSGPQIKECSFLLQANDRELLVGTNAGLFQIDLKTGKAVMVPGTRDMNVRSLHISRYYTKGLFITTYESGVYLFTQNKLIQFPLDRNNYLAAAHCIAEDKKGYFWISTNKGLFRFAVPDMLRYATDRLKGLKPAQSLYYSYYTKENGFLTNEFNGGCQPCMLTLPNGKISLPSLNGLVIFDPQNIEPILGNHTLILDRYDVSGKTYINKSDTILLDKNPEHISFNVTIAHFGNENERQLSYQISSVNGKPGTQAWIPVEGKDPAIRFSGLPYGNYNLMIRSQNGFGLSNVLTKKILIKVPPHWYESIWFRILCLAAILCAIYGYARIRTVFLIRKNEKLEEMIRIRTAKLQETLSALRSSEKELNRQMYIRDRLVASISHDLRTPMKYLIQSAERIEGLIAKTQYQQVSQIGKTVTKSSAHIVRLLENMVVYIKAQMYDDRLKLKTVDLRLLIKEKIDLFTPAFKEQSNRLQINLSTGHRVCSDPHLLGIIVHNLIDNANKYTYNGLIRISTEVIENELHLIIKDSGRGMPDLLVEWLNIPASGQVSPPDEWDGIGLLIVKEISAMIGVNIYVDNQNGTSIRLIFAPVLESFDLINNK